MKTTTIIPMATGVKGRRSRNGRSGQARTRLARAAVVQAATVYRLFSSKLGILKALGDLSIAGDDEALAVQDRPQVAALFAEPNPRKQLAGFAHINVAISTRTEHIYRVLVSAAASDPEAAALLAGYHRQRDQGQGQIARALARAGALRPRLRERDAADIIHALMSPELYRLLVSDGGWPPERYEQWLTGLLICQLLPPPAAGRELTHPFK